MRQSTSGTFSLPARAPTAESPIPTVGYDTLLCDIKERVRSARVRAAIAVNRELIELYWGIGREILRRQEDEGWGAKVIDRLAHDLRVEFPDMTGLSSRNLKYMRSFAEAWPDEAIVQQVAAQLPWFHNCLLLDKYKTDSDARIWYAKRAIAFGWSRSHLAGQINSGLRERVGSAPSNFQTALPKSDSDLVREMIKDPYNFEFLNATPEASEREIESGLIAHIQHFLLELGAGFAFVGRQYHLVLDGDDYFIDLLFYHLHLRRFVIVEIKNGKFKPEYAGKMNFYLAIVDDRLRHLDDAPSIGLILCRDKSKVTVEYALRNAYRRVSIPNGTHPSRHRQVEPADY